MPWVDPDGDPPYIGSLSRNPGDGSLFMGTNTGLFRISAKGGKPVKVTGTLVDLAVDPGDVKRWVATSEQGIYVSADEGKTWRQRDPTPNARLAWGAADELYRIDPGGPVKRSSDGGRTWAPLVTP